MKMMIKKISSILVFCLILVCFAPECVLAYFQQDDIIDISNEKLSYASYTKSNVLVIGEGASRKFFKEKYALVSPENIIKSETDKLFKNSTYMQGEIQKIFNKNLDFETSLSEIKKLQAFTDYNLYEFERNCMKKHTSSEFAKKYCNIPLDTNQDLSIRNVATTKMAELLGVQDLIANSICANIQNKDGKILEGILMDCAGGMESEELIHNKIKIEPSMQRALTSLQVFDSICGQCDRFYRNYNIILSSKGTAIGLCAFDNDWSFSLDTDMKRGRTWLPPIIDRDGKIKLPHMDKKLASCILKLDDHSVRNTLKDLLDEEYITATQNRVHQIQKAIRESTSFDEKFLLSDDEWSNETIKEELAEKYNETYTVSTTTAVFGRTYIKLLYDFINVK